LDIEEILTQSIFTGSFSRGSLRHLNKQFRSPNWSLSRASDRFRYFLVLFALPFKTVNSNRQKFKENGAKLLDNKIRNHPIILLEKEFHNRLVAWSDEEAA